MSMTLGKRSAQEAKLERFDVDRFRRLMPRERKIDIIQYCRKYDKNPAMIADMLIQVHEFITYQTFFDWGQRENGNTFAAIIKAGSFMASWDPSKFEAQIANTSFESIFINRISVRLQDRIAESQDKWIDALFAPDSPFSANRLSSLHMSLDDIDEVEYAPDLESHKRKYNMYIHDLRRIVQMPWMTQLDSDLAPKSLRVDFESEGDPDIEEYKIYVRISWFVALVSYDKDPPNLNNICRFILDLYNSCKSNKIMEKHVIKLLTIIFQSVNEHELAYDTIAEDLIGMLLKTSDLKFRIQFGQWAVNMRTSVDLTPELAMIYIQFIPFEHLTIRLDPNTKRVYPEIDGMVKLQFTLKDIVEGDNKDPIIEAKIKPMIHKVLDLGLPDIIVQQVVLSEYGMANEYLREKYETWLKSTIKDVERERSVALSIRR